MKKSNKRFHLLAISVSLLTICITYNAYSYTSNKKLIIANFIEALSIPNDGEFANIVLHYSKSKLFKSKVSTTVTWGGATGTSTSSEYVEYYCCVDALFDNVCRPYDDGINRNNYCKEFGEGIWSYSRQCLKD